MHRRKSTNTIRYKINSSLLGMNKYKFTKAGLEPVTFGLLY